MVPLPLWLRFAWAAAYITILGMHLWHAWGTRGQDRAWHLSYALLALGMCTMYLPLGLVYVPNAVGAVAFALAALVVGGWIAYAYARKRSLTSAWPIELFSMVGMAAMYVVRAGILLFVGYLGAGYFLSELCAWLTGTIHRPGVCRTRHMRVMMVASTAGMAYMFLAMLVGM